MFNRNVLVFFSVCICFILTVSTVLAAPTVSLDDLENTAGWTVSGSEAAPKLSKSKRQGSYSLSLVKSNTDSDYVRYTKHLQRLLDLTIYDRVSFQLYVPEPDKIKNISVWFGERERWSGGFVRNLEFKEGWNEISLFLFQFFSIDAEVNVWKRIEVFSIEITTFDASRTLDNILLDDLRLHVPESDTYRFHPLEPKDAPIARLHGEPFFPIGLYSVSIQNTEQEWKEIADSGFNFITCAEAYYFNEFVSRHKDVSKWIDFLDRAERHGLKVAVQLSSGDWTPRNSSSRSWWALDLNDDEVVVRNLQRIGRNKEDAVYSASRQRHMEYLKRIVAAIKDHPALGTYESLDEIAQYLFPVEGMIEGVRFLESLDSDTPYWHNHPSSVIDPRGLRHYGHFADIVSLDIYPIPSEFGYGGLPNKEINNIGEYTDLLRASTLTHQPAWMVLQAYTFNDNEFPGIQGKGLRRFPTRAELRFMTFQSIVHGSRGVIYFLYVTRPIEPIAHSHVNKPFTPEFWSALKELASDLSFMVPALVSETAKGMVRPSSPDDSVQCIVKTVGHEMWIVAVNESAQPVDAHFTLTTSVDELTVMFEERELMTADNRSFHDSFPAYGVHIYKVRSW